MNITITITISYYITITISYYYYYYIRMNGTQVFSGDTNVTQGFTTSPAKTA